jgi:hypothetical protein
MQQQVTCANSLVVVAVVEADKIVQSAFSLSSFFLIFIGMDILIRLSVSSKHACAPGNRVRATKNAESSF